MKDILNKYGAQLKEYWNNLNKSQKIKIVLILAITLASVSTLMAIVTRPHYVVLYSGLSQKDAGAVVEKLKSDFKIPYKIENGGSTILVPQQYRDEIRMQLATQGLPQSGFTIDDAFKNSSLGMTDMERQKRYIYFLQNEIADAIRTINGVQDAQVLIVVPDDSTFVLSSDRQEATAAIKVTLQPGATLNRQQVNGIVQFVSKSIQQLKPQNITLIDQNGTILNSSDNGEGYDIGAVNSQYELQREIETNIKNNVQSLLEQVFGPGNVAVRVNARLNFDTQKENSVEYSPVVDTNGIIRSIQDIKETQSNGNGTGGPVGASSNGTAGNTQVTGNPSSSNYTKTDRTINYEINEIRREIQKAKGSIQNLSVAVVINKNNLSPAVKQQVAQLVANATGARVNDVMVDSIPFNRSLANQMAQLAQQQAMARTRTNIIFGILGAALLFGGIFAYSFLKKRRTSSIQPQVAAPLEADTGISEDNVLVDKLSQTSVYRKELEKLIKEKPDVIAQLIKTLLQQD
ncbi:flagellar M-ring protein FliF [Caldanaerobius fijiensis DSM 17918]|uniref:Flagellar M-ring protein n=1 Tax=Caldanaerobius fijiensis DSM 17918 TaxID=1121256 RepID=A0A1M4XPD7_9THEO|nr:flagellar basal-body MS-ring/collar protein FliF [Caldanaerobius fijiensis]SHE95133.1 flagellar M-ring protein FliF [Caldanaerobius fijiensis DSM 17918]